MLRLFNRVIVEMATTTVTPAKIRSSVCWFMCCAVMPPSSEPAAVATSSTIPSLKLMRCDPVRPADTVLDVPMTVVRLMAAATPIGIPMPSVRNGTRKIPPPIPRVEPRAPATVPAARMISTRIGVMTGIGGFNDTAPPTAVVLWLLGGSAHAGRHCGSQDDERPTVHPQIAVVPARPEAEQRSRLVPRAQRAIRRACERADDGRDRAAREGLQVFCP